VFLCVFLLHDTRGQYLALSEGFTCVVVVVVVIVRMVSHLFTLMFTPGMVYLIDRVVCNRMETTIT